MIVDPKTKPTKFITALDTVDELLPVDIQSTHDSFAEAIAYAVTKRKRALRIYECKCVEIITAERRRQL